MEADFSQEDMESIQSGLDPSGFSSDLGSGDSAEDFNSFVTGLTPQQAYTTGRGAKSKALGDNVNNPFPESFFSKLFGAENVDYTNILNTPGGYTPAGINQLRFNQSQNPQNFGMGDFYLGQDTVLGQVKPVPSTIDNIINFLPGGGILNALIPQKGLAEFDPRRIAMIEEEQKSANDPTVFDRTTDFVKSILGFGPKDSGASLAASPTGDGQMRVPDTRTFDAFGNVTGSDLDKVQKVADVGETFKMLGDEINQYVSPTGKPVFGGSIKVDPLDKQIRYEVPVSNFLDNIFGRSA